MTIDELNFSCQEEREEDYRQIEDTLSVERYATERYEHEMLKKFFPQFYDDSFLI